MRLPSVHQLVFLAFIALFLVSAPLVVLYTAGYRWQLSQGVTRTGTLFVASVPDGARIVLNDMAEDEQTPAVIKTLLPGEYRVQLEREGHLPWEKRLMVYENTTTFIDRVLLFADRAPELLIREPAQHAVWSPDGELVAWSQTQEGWSEVWISTLESPASRLIERVATLTPPALEWRTGDVLAITIDNITRAVNAEGVSVPIPVSDPTAVRLQSGTDSVDVLFNGTLLARLPEGTYTIEDIRGPYILLADRAHEKIFLLTSADRSSPLLLEENAVFFDWIRQDALVFATRYAMSMYEPARHSTTLITRIGEPMRGLMWHPYGGSVFYATDHDVRAIELDDRDGRRVTVLATLPSLDTFFIDPRGRTLYLVGNDGIDRGIFIRPVTER